MDLDNETIAIIGLGLPLAVEFGKQHKVIGFDINPARVAELITPLSSWLSGTSSSSP